MKEHIAHSPTLFLLQEVANASAALIFCSEDCLSNPLLSFVIVGFSASLKASHCSMITGTFSENFSSILGAVCAQQNPASKKLSINV